MDAFVWVLLLCLVGLFWDFYWFGVLCIYSLWFVSAFLFIWGLLGFVCGCSGFGSCRVFALFLFCDVVSYFLFGFRVVFVGVVVCSLFYVSCVWLGFSFWFIVLYVDVCFVVFVGLVLGVWLVLFLVLFPLGFVVVFCYLSIWCCLVLLFGVVFSLFFPCVGWVLWLVVSVVSVVYGLV